MLMHTFLPLCFFFCECVVAVQFSHSLVSLRHSPLCMCHSNLRDTMSIVLPSCLLSCFPSFFIVIICLPSPMPLHTHAEEDPTLTSWCVVCVFVPPPPLVCCSLLLPLFIYFIPPPRDIFPKHLLCTCCEPYELLCFIGITSPEGKTKKKKRRPSVRSAHVRRSSFVHLQSTSSSSDLLLFIVLPTLRSSVCLCSPLTLV